jgi:hypothetical protein
MAVQGSANGRNTAVQEAPAAHESGVAPLRFFAWSTPRITW